ncbi:MAG: putative ABC transport system ATP-binding protein, partial [Glaciecola sp.]
MTTKNVTPMKPVDTDVSKKVIIEMKNLTKVFSTENIETHALRGVDLTINNQDY